MWARIEKKTGFEGISRLLVAYFLRTGWMGNRHHVYSVQASDLNRDFVAQPGMALKYVMAEEP